jgi:predicted  nucleic acid-binding Zn-ribbon protein
MVNVRCADLSCGVEFGIPEHVERQARGNSSRVVHCPNGHRFYYADSEPEKLRKRIEQLEQSMKNWSASCEAAELRTERALRTARYWQGIAHRKRKS